MMNYIMCKIKINLLECVMKVRVFGSGDIINVLLFLALCGGNYLFYATDAVQFCQ